jgi:hypothetical protein
MGVVHSVLSSSWPKGLTGPWSTWDFKFGHTMTSYCSSNAGVGCQSRVSVMEVYSSLFSESVLIIRYDKMVSHMMPNMCISICY